MKVNMLGACVQFPVCSLLGPRSVRSYELAPPWMPGYNPVTLAGFHIARKTSRQVLGWR